MTPDFTCTQRWHFNPLNVIGGKVYFGTYYEFTVDGRTEHMTRLQYTIKRSMGLCR